MRACFLRQACSVAALAAAAAFTSVASPTAHAADELNVYNWSDYIAPDTIPNFQKQTGIHVKYDNYDSDDTLQAKLLAGSSGYDIVVPTSNYMAKHPGRRVPEARQVEAAEPREPRPALDEDDLGCRSGQPVRRARAYGTDGIGYNAQAVKKALGDKAPVDSWALVFDPANMEKLKSCGVSFLDHTVDVFAATLQYMGRIRTARIPATTRLRSKS